MLSNLYIEEDVIKYLMIYGLLSKKKVKSDLYGNQKNNKKIYKNIKVKKNVNIFI